LKTAWTIMVTYKMPSIRCSLNFATILSRDHLV